MDRPPERSYPGWVTARPKAAPHPRFPSARTHVHNCARAVNPSAQGEFRGSREETSCDCRWLLPLSPAFSRWRSLPMPTIETPPRPWRRGAPTEPPARRRVGIHAAYAARTSHASWRQPLQRPAERFFRQSDCRRASSTRARRWHSLRPSTSQDFLNRRSSTTR